MRIDPMTLISFGSLDELVPQTILCRRLAGAGQVIVVRVAGTAEIIAFEARCPHAGGPLALGKLRGPVVVCPWHLFPFDLRTGKVVSGESTLQLTRYPVSVEGGEILVDVEKPE
jgi:nitrite reductase/ring-hydroxylating ferredoxin subunit